LLIHILQAFGLEEKSCICFGKAMVPGISFALTSCSSMSCMHLVWKTNPDIRFGSPMVLPALVYVLHAFGLENKS
jgi:hypothetical protein